MGLELKHLAPYLPYNLMVYCDFRDGDITHSELQGITTEEAFLYDCDWNYKENKDFKPILRPLSELTKQEHKHIYADFNIIILPKMSEEIDGYSHELVKRFIENHFDIFGLISQGLAIDINTLAENK